jgi:hypothetical protein
VSRPAALALACALLVALAQGRAHAEPPGCEGGDEPGRRVVRVVAPADGAARGLEEALERATADPARTVLELEGTWFLDRPLELGPRHGG